MNKMNGHDVLARRFRCTRYGKYILNIFQNFKKIGTKISDVYPNIRCSYKKFRKKTFFVACVKKTKKNV